MTPTMLKHRLRLVAVRALLLDGAFQRSHQSLAARKPRSSAPLRGRKRPRLHVQALFHLMDNARTCLTSLHRSARKCAALPLSRDAIPLSLLDTGPSTQRFPASQSFSHSIVYAAMKTIARSVASCTGGYQPTFPDPMGTGVGRHAHHLQSEKPS